jgi:hypothetical protein
MDTEVDTEAAAMAAAMGFSAFGAQDRPQKKRRYNPAVDAVAKASSPGLRAAPTGSNSTPLGTHAMTSKEAASSHANANADETNLDGSDDGQPGAAPQESQQQQAEPPHHGLPARPAPGTGFVGLSSRFAARPDASPGHTSKVWYEGYYDSTSNENPWEHIERTMGIGSKGTWVSRQTHPPANISATT